LPERQAIDSEEAVHRVSTMRDIAEDLVALFSRLRRNPEIASEACVEGADPAGLHAQGESLQPGVVNFKWFALWMSSAARKEP
jgi:hypothetical protein